MVLTFDKIPDNGTCTAAYQIAAGIRIEEATGERPATRFDSASARVPGQVRIEVNPSIYGATRDDRFRMRMLLAGCGYREVDKGDLGSAATLWGAGFVIAAFDHSTDLRALKKQTEDFNEALSIAKDEAKYIKAANEYIWTLEEAAGVPHSSVARRPADAPEISQRKQSKKGALLEALRAAVVGGAEGYAEYQRSLAVRQPLHCTGQQMGWLFTMTCQ
jgi:hypothetical protein